MAQHYTFYVRNMHFARKLRQFKFCFFIEIFFFWFNLLQSNVMGEINEYRNLLKIKRKKKLTASSAFPARCMFLFYFQFFSSLLTLLVIEMFSLLPKYVFSSIFHVFLSGHYSLSFRHDTIHCLIPFVFSSFSIFYFCPFKFKCVKQLQCFSVVQQLAVNVLWTAVTRVIPLTTILIIPFFFLLLLFFIELDAWQTGVLQCCGRKTHPTDANDKSYIK